MTMVGAVGRFLRAILEMALPDMGDMTVVGVRPIWSALMRWISKHPDGCSWFAPKQFTGMFAST